MGPRRCAAYLLNDHSPAWTCAAFRGPPALPCVTATRAFVLCSRLVLWRGSMTVMRRRLQAGLPFELPPRKRSHSTASDLREHQWFCESNSTAELKDSDVPLTWPLAIELAQWRSMDDSYAAESRPRHDILKMIHTSTHSTQLDVEFATRHRASMTTNVFLADRQSPTEHVLPRQTLATGLISSTTLELELQTLLRSTNTQLT